MKSEIEEKLYSDDNLDTSTFKCPCCGGEAKFSPKKQMLECLYCGECFNIEDKKTIQENSLSELLTKAVVWKDAEVYKCPSCGAKEIISSQNVALNCSFCGSSNIVKTVELAGLKPQGIVPFEMEKEQVLPLLSKWVKKKWLAPKKFKKTAKPENIKEIYDPVFTFDSDTYSLYEGKLRKDEVRRSGDRTYVTHKYFNIKGDYSQKFDDLLIPASSNLTYKDLAELAPFKTNTAIEYKTEFLRGYTASAYSKGGNDCWEECKTQIKTSIRNNILSKYDYDAVESLNINTTYSNNTYKYVLVPLYVGHHTYNKKLYNFYINGVTGKITGKFPISPIKVTFLVIVGIIILALLLKFFVTDGG